MIEIIILIFTFCFGILVTFCWIMLRESFTIGNRSFYVHEIEPEDMPIEIQVREGFGGVKETVLVSKGRRYEM